MSVKRIDTRDGVLGSKLHFDENNRLIGESRKGILGEEIFLSLQSSFPAFRKRIDLNTSGEMPAAKQSF